MHNRRLLNRPATRRAAAGGGCARGGRAGAGAGAVRTRVRAGAGAGSVFAHCSFRAAGGRDSDASAARDIVVLGEGRGAPPSTKYPSPWYGRVPSIVRTSRLGRGSQNTYYNTYIAVACRRRRARDALRRQVTSKSGTASAAAEPYGDAAIPCSTDPFHERFSLGMGPAEAHHGAGDQPWASK